MVVSFSNLHRWISYIPEGTKETVKAVGWLIDKFPLRHIEALGSSTADYTCFVINTVTLIETIECLNKNPKYFGMKVAQAAELSFSLAGDTFKFLSSLSEPVWVAGKVTFATAGIFAGLGSSAIGVGIETYRVHQTLHEMKTVRDRSVNLDDHGRIPFKEIFGVKRKELDSVARTEDFYQHLSTRLKVKLAFRAAAIATGVASIAGIILLAVLPTPALPVAWVILATVTLGAVATLIAKYAINRSLNKQLHHIKESQGYTGVIRRIDEVARREMKLFFDDDLKDKPKEEKG